MQTSDVVNGEQGRGRGFRNKAQAGYYETGDGERMTVNINGTDVRMGPNSSMRPQTPAPRWMPAWMQNIQQQQQQIEQEPSGINGVRGSIPNPYKGASPLPAWMRQQQQRMPAWMRGGR